MILTYFLHLADIHDILPCDNFRNVRTDEFCYVAMLYEQTRF